MACFIGRSSGSAPVAGRAGGESVIGGSITGVVCAIAGGLKTLLFGIAAGCRDGCAISRGPGDGNPRALRSI
jgi:hypothetical protein